MTATPTSRSYLDIVAGGASGLFCGLVFQPLEVIKVNMIILPKNYQNYRSRSFVDNFVGVSKLMYQEEGLKSFWRGTTPSVLRSTASAAIYFYILRTLDDIDKRKHSKETVYDFLNSAIARSVTAVITNPLTIIRTRSELIGCNDYSNFLRSCKLIYQKEGMRSFYKGGLLLLLEEFPFGGIFNATYEGINRKMGNHSSNSNLGFILSGTIAGIVATTLTHPFELCRTKLQSQKVDFNRRVKNSVILSILYDTHERYGYRGFLKGLLPRLLKKTMVNASTFAMYEAIRKRDHK